MTSFPSNPTADLDEDERRVLHDLDQRLRRIEAHFSAAAAVVAEELERSLAAPWLTDFEIGLTIDCRRRDQDPDDDAPDDDDVVATLSVSLKHVRPARGYGFGALDVDHGEPGRGLGFPQCWSFHQLFDHCGLDRRDLLRVGDIDVDFAVVRQGRLPPD
jgi:hypothetical protein